MVPPKKPAPAKGKKPAAPAKGKMPPALLAKMAGKKKPPAKGA